MKVSLIKVSSMKINQIKVFLCTNIIWFDESQSDERSIGRMDELGVAYYFHP
jgi:hypothetical protein